MEENIGDMPGSEFQSQGIRIECFPKLFWYWAWDKSSVVRRSWIQIRICGLRIPRQEQRLCPQLSVTIGED